MQIPKHNLLLYTPRLEEGFLGGCVICYVTIGSPTLLPKMFGFLFSELADHDLSKGVERI